LDSVPSALLLAKVFTLLSSRDLTAFICTSKHNRHDRGVPLDWGNLFSPFSRLVSLFSFLIDLLSVSHFSFPHIASLSNTCPSLHTGAWPWHYCKDHGVAIRIITPANPAQPNDAHEEPPFACMIKSGWLEHPKPHFCQVCVTPLCSENSHQCVNCDEWYCKGCKIDRDAHDCTECGECQSFDVKICAECNALMCRNCFTGGRPRIQDCCKCCEDLCDVCAQGWNICETCREPLCGGCMPQCVCGDICIRKWPW
jgi:hypothetical protein